MVFENENLGDITTARYVRRSRTVAALAALVGRAAFGIEHGLPMWTLLPPVIDLLVARLAYFCANVFSRRAAC